MSDEPPVVKLSEKRRKRLGLGLGRVDESKLGSVSEYMRDVVEPRLREEEKNKTPPTNVGYPHMKRRRV